MFEQLTWSIGMFTQAAFLILGLIFLLRRTEVVRTLIFNPKGHHELDFSQRLIQPALSVAAVYLLILCLLWVFYDDTDTTALNWAVAVWLIGVMLIGPAASLLAAIPVILSRALIVFFNDSDPLTMQDYSEKTFYLLTPDFWIDEAWMWLQPEVLELAAAWAVGALAFWIWRHRMHTDYPLYIGIPIAIVVQGTFVASAMVQWGYMNGLAYLKSEALPSTIALALAILLFVMTLAMARAEYESKRARIAELDAARERLRFLNAQIDPHFLNNSLSAISGVVIKSPDTAQQLLSSLGDYFRDKCTNTETLVSVAEELHTTQQYIALEKARFGERLTITFDVHGDTLSMRIPRMVIQPLVENAIRHGVEKNPGPGRIIVSADIEEARLVIRVTDNGGGLMQPLTISDYGVGLSNVSARLERLCGEKSSCKVSSEWGAGTTATLIVGTSCHYPLANQTEGVTGLAGIAGTSDVVTTLSPENTRQRNLATKV